jgi:hypothetical protein
MKIKSKIIYFVFLLSLSGCVAVGTKTLYKVSEPQAIRSLGFSKLQEGEIIKQVCSEAEEIFQQTVPRSFNDYGISNVTYINEEINYESPDTERIKEICSQRELEAILITKLKFIHVTYSFYMIPIAQNYDTEVETKLIDKHGNLIYNIRHNTYKGNSYMMPPSAERTVKDGVIGTINRIVKEMGLKKDKKKTIANKS